VLPTAPDRERLDALIFDELVNGIVQASTRATIAKIIAGLRCEAVALACTELPLAVDGAGIRVPTLDSTRILARAALRPAAS
jgi:aspartate racemase